VIQSIPYVVSSLEFITNSPSKLIQLVLIQVLKSKKEQLGAVLRFYVLSKTFLFYFSVTLNLLTRVFNLLAIMYKVSFSLIFSSAVAAT
jgi:hypothetical protein